MRPTVLVLGPSRAAISGVSTHVSLLLGSTLAREFDLVHFQVGSEGRAESAAGRLARLAASPFALAAALARNGASIMHVNTSLNARAFWRDLAYVLAAKLCGVRVVLQIHGGALREFCRAGAPARRLVGAALQWPDAVVVLSRSELEAAREIAPRLQVALLPNGIDCAPFLCQPRPARAPGAPLRLVYLGRFARTKGLFEIMDALALVRRRGVAAQLVVAGGGPEEAALRRSVRALGLEECVRFVGPAFGEAKVQLLADSEVLLLPSVHLEGLPYALLESMAAGLVPVVTRVGAIPDVVDEGVHGLFVPGREPGALAEAIAALAAGRERLAQMSLACRRRVAADYSLERLAADFATLYSRVLSWAPSRAG